MEVPLTLTVAVEENAFQFFNALKKIYLPEEDKFSDAHLTLFQLLPNDSCVVEVIEAVCKQYNTMCLQVKQPTFVDNGVIYEIDCPELLQLHQHLQQKWEDFLIPQDQQQLWPRIVIQDKVSMTAANELLEFLNENFSAFHARATGLQLWECNDGARKLFKQFEFEKN
jgi:guanylate kinase